MILAALLGFLFLRSWHDLAMLYTFRLYRYKKPCDGRAEIFAAWEQRDILAAPSKLQHESSPHAPIVPPPKFVPPPNI